MSKNSFSWISNDPDCQNSNKNIGQKVEKSEEEGVKNFSREKMIGSNLLV